MTGCQLRDHKSNGVRHVEGEMARGAHADWRRGLTSCCCRLRLQSRGCRRWWVGAARLLPLQEPWTAPPANDDKRPVEFSAKGEGGSSVLKVHQSPHLIARLRFCLFGRISGQPQIKNTKRRSPLIPFRFQNHFLETCAASFKSSH